MVLEGIYVVLLFIVYRTIMSVSDFSINTAIYGLFVLLIFFYYITDNLNFRKQGKYSPVWINAIIFLIFLFFYKKIGLFLGFLMFSVFQLSFERVLKKMSMKEEDVYNPSIFSLRSFIKIMLDVTSIVLGVVFTFVIKYNMDWYKYLNKEYILMYTGIFLLIYLFKRMSEKSCSYTNILDVSDLMYLNIATAIIFTIFIYIVKILMYLKMTITKKIQACYLIDGGWWVYES